MPTPFEQSVRAAVRRGVDYLLAHQDDDGFWREFDLAPGPSEAWTTAWVGWCLARAVPDGTARQARTRDACLRAAASVWRSRRVDGWGYNRRTGPDADSTSWVLRYLRACDVGVEPTPYLSPYVDARGGVHTFLELDYGAWTHAHDDVAANAGLALLTASAAQPVIARIRRRLASSFPGHTFWWSTATYGAAWTLRFLRAGGGVAPEIRDAARGWISGLPESDAPFEVAHRLMAVAQIDGCRCGGVALVNQLLDLAGPDGWPGGSFLLVPARDGARTPPNPERRALMTTAICVATLSEWLNAAADS